LSEQLPTSGSSEGQRPPEQAVTPGSMGPVPGRPDFTPGPESTAAVPAKESNLAPDPAPDLPLLQKPRRGRRLAKKPEEPATPLTAEQRLLVLDAWQRSGLPARDFAPLVGMSRHTLYAWKKKFDTEGPAGLMDKARGGPKGSRLPELTKRTILMLKQSNPEWGVERITAMLLRGPGLQASPSAVAKVLHEAGYELEEAPTKPHPDKVRSFERAKPNQLWQTDLFTFILDQPC
jgi:transposase